MKPENGSLAEDQVAVTVNRYFQKLGLETAGLPFRRADENKKLIYAIRRSRGAIVLRHENTSAVVEEMGLPYLAGSMPCSNYQAERCTSVNAAIESKAVSETRHTLVRPELVEELKVIGDRSRM